ncbi:hypothetical protein [Magnetospirillum molischianum]|uniref:Uncharacterized protein n=1 Tax=Magnetospirillum molischianum DSM 120 TaxID=1150626 RepID=H8FP24_MAGML|nr:hypothetical protein [Magnetospirillum molischianum]CCG40112.1 conserved hypothetical protein [Magnetospirillum molischianum DSM 120]
MNAPICPSCGEPAAEVQTSYGIKHRCCGLWSWHGKPLVSAEIHRARQHCHEVVDRLWRDAPGAYDIKEKPGTDEYAAAVRRIQKSARNRTYRWIADQLGLPEPECHMAAQTDLAKLRLIWRAARDATPAIVRDWAKQQEPRQ